MLLGPFHRCTNEELEKSRETATEWQNQEFNAELPTPCLFPVLSDESSCVINKKSGERGGEEMDSNGFTKAKK